MPLNRGWSYREQVGAGAAGRTVLAHLAESRPHSSPHAWAERLRQGQVEVDGVPAHAETVLAAGQVLVWHRPPWDEPDVPLYFDLLYEDAAVLAVGKPSGLPTMPAGGFLQHTLLALVSAQFPGARPVHRLGRHTSGVVVFARSRDAASSLSRAWRGHEVLKRYRAVGAGVASWEAMAITAPIGPVPHPRLGSVHAASPRGRPSRSAAAVLERREGSTLFGVDITTGRPHQVRIHLAVAGHPLVGDPLYGPGGLPLDAPGLPGDGGYLLHAACVAFAHPSSLAMLRIDAPVPARLRTAHGA
jgi:23S rRNA pseudouridine1911/1915/1917 synthase